MIKPIVVSAAFAALCACASRPPDRNFDRDGGPPGAAFNQTERLLSGARRLEAAKGCEAAIPLYRVSASMGAGHEIGQFELASCLLEREGASPAETTLLRDEALLWLNRAAWAGEARAQHLLAETLSGAETQRVEGIAPDPARALGWAIVYEENPSRELYALPSVTALDHLNATLSPALKASAEAFADDFEEIEMALFDPASLGGGRRGGAREEGRGGGRGGPGGGGPGGGGPGGGGGPRQPR
ncbi:MAG: hypothetical protein AAGC77_05435 [Pseudomonadota bacterium]